MPSHPQLDALAELKRETASWCFKDSDGDCVASRADLEDAIDRAFSLALSLAEERVSKVPRISSTGIDYEFISRTEALSAISSLKKEE